MDQIMVAKAKSELNDWLLVRGKYAMLSKEEREKVESEYHRMKPEDFDKAMTRAKRHAPVAISRSKRKSKASEKRRAA